MTDLSRIPHLGVLRLEGPDAATFLQGQATCDTRQISATRGALGALCNLQGRMIVSFLVLPADDGLALVMPRDRIAAIISHLKKYAVFSKVALRDADDLAVVAPGASAAAATSGEPFDVAHSGGITLMRLRDGRSVGIAPVAEVAALPDGGADWRVAALRAGEWLVDTAAADRYLPQAFNYDVIDGVSFRKGCYTGQEVVARMHFKGRMKERLYVLEVPGLDAPEAQSSLHDGEGHAVGEVVAAVRAGNDCVLAAVVRHEAMQGSRLQAVTGDIPLPESLRTPYPVPGGS